MFNLFKKNNENNTEMTDFLLEHIEGHESYQENDLFQYDIEKIGKLLKREKVTTGFDLNSFEDYLDFIKLYDSPFYLYRNFAEEEQPYFSFYTEIESVEEVCSKESTRRIVEFYQNALSNHVSTKSEKEKVKKLIKLYKNKFKTFKKSFTESIDHNVEEFKELEKKAETIMSGLMSLHSINRTDNKSSIIKVLREQELIQDIVRNNYESKIEVLKEDILLLAEDALSNDLFFEFILFLLIFREKAQRENNKENNDFNRNVVLPQIEDETKKMMILRLANVFLYNVIFVGEKTVSESPTLTQISFNCEGKKSLTIPFSEKVYALNDNTFSLITLEKSFNPVCKELMIALKRDKEYIILNDYVYDHYNSQRYKENFYGIPLDEEMIKRVLQKSMTMKNYPLQEVLYSYIRKVGGGGKLSEELFLSLVSQTIAYSDIKALEIMKNYYTREIYTSASVVQDGDVKEVSANNSIFKKISDRGINDISKQIAQSIYSSAEKDRSKDLRLFTFIEEELGIKISYEDILKETIDLKNQSKDYKFIASFELDSFFSSKVNIKLKKSYAEVLLKSNFVEVVKNNSSSPYNFEYKEDSSGNNDYDDLFPSNESFKLFVENMNQDLSNFKKLFLDLSFNFKNNRIEIMCEFLKENNEKLLKRVINMVSEDGYNCLNYAIFEDKMDLAVILLKYNINVNFIDDEGDTAVTLLDEKISEQHNDYLVKLKANIIRKGYRISKEDIEERVNLTDLLDEMSDLNIDDLSIDDKSVLALKFVKLYRQERLIEFLEHIFNNDQSEKIEIFRELWFDNIIQDNPHIDMKEINSFIIEELV